MEVIREVTTTKNGTPKYLYWYDGIAFPTKKLALQVKEKYEQERSQSSSEVPENIPTVTVDGELIDETTLSVPCQSSDDAWMDDGRTRKLTDIADIALRGLQRVSDVITESRIRDEARAREQAIRDEADRVKYAKITGRVV